MSGKIEFNLTEAKEFSQQEEITELNDSGTNDTTVIESADSLMPQGGEELISYGTINPPPPKPEVSTEPEVFTEPKVFTV